MEEARSEAVRVNEKLIETTSSNELKVRDLEDAMEAISRLQYKATQRVDEFGRLKGEVERAAVAVMGEAKKGILDLNGRLDEARATIVRLKDANGNNQLKDRKLQEVFRSHLMRT